MKFDVFLSRKTEDVSHSMRVYEFLTEAGLKVFDASISLAEMGISDYSKAIDIALENCTHLVVVASSAVNASSSWVEAEWRFFLNKKRAGKINGNLLCIVDKQVEIFDLPPSLQNFEIMNYYELERLLPYVLSNPISEPKRSTRQKSSTQIEIISNIKTKSSFENELLFFLERFETKEGFYFRDKIPTKKINNARNEISIPESESVFALIDATTFGSAKHSMVFCTTGIYYSNAWNAKSPGSFYFSYRDLIKQTFTTSGLFEIQLGKDMYFYSAAVSLSRKELVEILEGIRIITNKFHP